MKTIIDGFIGRKAAVSASIILLLAANANMVSGAVGGEEGEQEKPMMTMLRQQQQPSAGGSRELFSWSDLTNLLHPGGGGGGSSSHSSSSSSGSSGGSSGSGGGSGGGSSGSSSGGGGGGGGDGSDNKVSQDGYGLWSRVKCYFTTGCTYTSTSSQEASVAVDPYDNGENGNSDVGTNSDGGSGGGTAIMSQSSSKGIWGVAIAAIVALAGVAAFIVYRNRREVAIEKDVHPLDGSVSKRMALLPTHKAAGDGASLAAATASTAAPTIIEMTPSDNYVSMDAQPEGNGLVPAQDDPPSAAPSGECASSDGSGGDYVDMSDGDASPGLGGQVPFARATPSHEAFRSSYAAEMSTSPGGPMWAAAGAAAAATGTASATVPSAAPGGGAPEEDEDASQAPPSDEDSAATDSSAASI